MHRTKTALTIALLLISSFFFIQKVNASVGQAKVYIICLSDVPTDGSWVDDPQLVRNGAIDASMLKGLYIDANVPRAHPKMNIDYPPYYEATPYVVTSWSQYVSIITSYIGVIVVNTHGQYLLVPSGYTREQWVDKIADAMLTRRLTWVHVGGYTFFRVWYQQTGTGEEWGEQGFRRFMSHINKGDVNLWPSPYSENENATMELGDQQIGLNWFDKDGVPITYYRYATLGRPLKINDFKEYLILPIFKFNDTWSGAAIAFANASKRYKDGYGGGAYVHIGARYLYNVDGIELNADYGRGFVGTAAALWVESMGFNGKMDEKQGGSIWGPNSENATLTVYPSISGVYLSGNDLIVRMVFAIWGATQSHQDDVLDFDWVRFSIHEVSGSIWSNVTMMASLAYSREGYGGGLVLSGLYDKNQVNVGLLSSGLMWILGTPTVLEGHPVATAILWGIKGVLLFGQWLAQAKTPPYYGVDEFDDFIWFKYRPRQNCTISGGKAYWEFMTFTTVELKIPAYGKSGWKILPLSYNITAHPTWYAGYPTPDLVAADTLELAIWFDGAGQSDAGSNRDASNGNPVSVTFPGSYHGYLGGGDNDDWYNFTMTSGKSISINMTPPPFVNFDLELYRPNGTLKAESHQNAGITDIIRCTTDSGGTWKLKIYRVQGSGVYSFNLEWAYILTVKTRKTSGQEITGVKVWVDGSLSSSTVNVIVSTGAHSVQVETEFIRGSFEYTFSQWENSSTNNPRTVIVSSDMTTIAYYYVEYIGPCPTLFVWNGTDYAYETLLNIHAESDITLQHRITQPLVKDGPFYRLSLRELDQFTSHIDQVKLYAVDTNGETYTLNLTRAVHNELGNVRTTLLFDDDTRIDLHLTETIDLDFTLPSFKGTIAYFTFEINGHNRKIP